MGSFDGPIKLTFSLDAHRTVITKVVGKKRREEVRKEGRRLKSDEALSLSFNPIVRASIARSLARTDSLGGAGDIWLSDDPILMSPIVVARARRGARPLAHPAARRGGDDENGSDSQMFCYLIFFSSACALRPAHPPLVSLHPTKGAISLVSFILATFLVAQFWRKSSARHASPIERRIAAPISLPVTKQAKPR